MGSVWFLDSGVSFHVIGDRYLFSDLDEKDLALVKALKDFREYILHSHIIAYVPNAVVKDILTQNGPDGK